MGANLGDPRSTLIDAMRRLATCPATELVAVSSAYRSAPVDASGPEFVNAVAELRTALAPHELLHALQQIEQVHARARPYRNAPRTLDLDLLLYDDAAIDDTVLTVPHPRMHRRAFVLLPLAELAPDLTLPGMGKVGDLLAAVSDQAIERIGSLART
jgi:2-amino-4-hydroxy-6-hydroxymethyldihydropteridine diphosphokinase